jgi:hypothetical protein
MWIKSKDRLPKDEEFVLVKYENRVTIGYVTDYGKWRVLYNMMYEEPIDYDYEVELWMPLPSLP